MKRNEVQKIIPVTRKAMDYYEDLGFIHPTRLENGYRSYSMEDVEQLKKIQTLRSLDVDTKTIAEILDNVPSIQSTIKQQKQLDLKRYELLERYLNGENIETELQKLNSLSSIFKTISINFPGYFGILFTSSYKPFLDDISENDLPKLIQVLDSLPPFHLSKDEMNYLEEQTSSFTIKDLDNIQNDKQKNIDDYNTFLVSHKEELDAYMSFKQSETYRNSMMYDIEQKLHSYMISSDYYNKVIPTLRSISASYDEYYKKLLTLSKEKN